MLQSPFPLSDAGRLLPEARGYAHIQSIFPRAWVGAMAGMKELLRDYERARFPADRRLDLHGEGPRVARERALHWIRSRAHEEPGQELLLVVERGVPPGRPPSAVAVAVRKLLQELQGKLIDWWQPFTPGSLALRIAPEPSVLPPEGARRDDEGDGRTEATAGVARPPPRDDIPAALLERAVRAAELRIEREALSVRLRDVVLREIWIEVQALAMERRLSFEAALDRVYEGERRAADPTHED